MPSRTVQFYEDLIEHTMMDTVKRNSDLFYNSYHVPLDEIGSASSIFSLMERYALPINLVNTFLIGAINSLMSEYSFDTGIPPRNIFNTLFLRQPEAADQSYVAHQIISTCDDSLMLQLNKQPLQSCIDSIKALLAEGLLATNLHPQDNFPNIVKALANKTAGVSGWEFNEDVVQRLSVNPTLQT